MMYLYQKVPDEELESAYLNVFAAPRELPFEDFTVDSTKDLKSSRSEKFDQEVD